MPDTYFITDLLNLQWNYLVKLALPYIFYNS